MALGKLYSLSEDSFQQRLVDLVQHTTKRFDGKATEFEGKNIRSYSKKDLTMSISCNISNSGWLEADPKKMTEDMAAFGLSLLRK